MKLRTPGGRLRPTRNSDPSRVYHCPGDPKGSERPQRSPGSGEAGPGVRRREGSRKEIFGLTETQRHSRNS